MVTRWSRVLDALMPERVLQRGMEEIREIERREDLGGYVINLACNVPGETGQRLLSNLLDGQAESWERKAVIYDRIGLPQEAAALRHSIKIRREWKS